MAVREETRETEIVEALKSASTAQLIFELHARAEESQTMWDDFGTPDDSK